MKNRFRALFLVLSAAMIPTQAGAIGGAGAPPPVADTVGVVGVLGSANATATVTLNGQAGAGMLLSAGTLVGTLTPEISYDGGTTWVATSFYDPAAQTTSATIVFGSANTVTTRSILISGGASHARVRVSAYTSGTANATLRATNNAVPATALGIPGTAPGVAAPPNSTISVQNPALDPCQTQAHTYTPINISTAIVKVIVAGTAAKKTYLCHLFLFGAGADNVGVFEATTATTCATSPIAMIGGATSVATAATGLVLAANQGFVLGGGQNSVAATTVANNDFCLATSQAVQLSGVAVTANQ